MDLQEILKSIFLNEYFIFAIFVIIISANSISMHNKLECSNKDIDACPSMKDKCVKNYDLINIINILMLSVSTIIVTGIIFVSIRSNL